MIITMKTYIITRFSIFDYKNNSFKITQGRSRNAYKSKLFSPRRLRFKFKVFEKMTLPSVINQTNKDWIWYIYSSAFLPEEFKERLKKITEPYKQIRCKFIESFDEFRFTPDKEDRNSYCTMRLDDDDGINKCFVEKLQKYENYSKFIITHKRGITFSIENDNIEYGKRISYRLGGVGLTAIGMNIYNCGHHMKIGENFKTKIKCDDTEEMFYLCCSDYCDSGRNDKNNTNT
jgi:hypothetical protein